MQKYRLLKSLFKLGISYNESHNDNVRKELLNYLEVNGSDCHIEDGLRILDTWREENSTNDFDACCRIAEPIFDRLLSGDVTWEYFDIRILAAVIDYAGTCVEVCNLAEKILVKLEDHSHEERYPFIKLAVYMNSSLRLLRGKYFESENLIPSEELEKLFSDCIEKALSAWEEMGLEVQKALMQVRKGLFYRKSDLVNHGLYRLKELGEHELYRMTEADAEEYEYEFFKSIQISKFQFSRIVGANIRKKRKELGFTIAQVSEITDIGPSHLSIIEIGQKPATSYDLFKLGELFGVSTDWFFQGIENKRVLTDDRTEHLMALKELSDSFSKEQVEHLLRLAQGMVQ